MIRRSEKSICACPYIGRSGSKAIGLSPAALSGRSYRKPRGSSAQAGASEDEPGEEREREPPHLATSSRGDLEPLVREGTGQQQQAEGQERQDAVDRVELREVEEEDLADCEPEEREARQSAACW